jgi:hypothetical protein
MAPVIGDRVIAAPACLCASRALFESEGEE